MSPQRPPSTDNAFIVQVQPADTPKHQLGDVIVGSLGLTGAMAVAAVMAGILLGSLWILRRKTRRTFDTDAPPSLGSVPLGVDPKSEFDERSDR